MDKLINKFTQYNKNIAIIDNGNHYSYNDLINNINEYKTLWLNKIQPGDVVVILSDYSFHSISVFFALAQLKAIIAPITSSIESEINNKIEISDCKWIIKITDGENVNIISRNNTLSTSHQLVEKLTKLQHPGLIIFSSGSTGSPKAMVHDLTNLVNLHLERKEKKLTFIIFLMFDHIGGLNSLLSSLSMSAKLIIPDSREPSHICMLIEKHQVNVLPSSPTFLNLILISGANLNYDLSSLKMITYGTETMPQQLLERIKKAFPRTRLLQTFGTSETGIAQTSSASSTTTLMKIDDPNTEIKIVDGELWVRSKSQILGYLNASMDSFTEDGWFRTGDLVETNDEGYLRIQGRIKEIINVGGEKVLPTEIETILLAMEIVQDCMVYGESNSITGQTVVADIVLDDRVYPIDHINARRQIRIHCLKKLDRYKVPTRLNFVSQTTYSERFKKVRLSKSKQ